MEAFIVIIVINLFQVDKKRKTLTENSTSHVAIPYLIC